MLNSRHYIFRVKLYNDDLDIRTYHLSHTFLAWSAKGLMENKIFDFKKYILGSKTKHTSLSEDKLLVFG